MKKKIWIIILAVVLAAVSCVAAFWNTISIYVAPKAVLTAALSNTVSQLQERLRQSPVTILANTLNSEGQYTAQMRIDTENSLVGEIAYDMSVQLDAPSNRLLAEGTSTTSSGVMDLSLYLDKDFMAVSSENLLKGAYYGITYDTFSSDIRSVPLLSLFISDQVLSQWQESISGIQTQMSHNYQIPEIPEMTEADIQKLLTAVLLLDSDVERIEMQVGEENVECYRITYSAEGEEVMEMLSYLMDTGDASDGVLSAAFCVYDNQVIHVQLQGHAGENSILYMLELPPEMQGTITLRASLTENGEDSGFCSRYDTEESSGYLNETWAFYPDFKGAEEGTLISYRWEPSAGELVLSGEEPVTLYLTETEGGFRMETDSFHQLVKGESKEVSAPASCTMTVSEGSTIETPGYKNLDQWSLEDLLTLLGGVGGLFGLKLD